MKKKLALIITTLLTICILCGCNKQIFDFEYHFDHAILKLPNGEIIEGEIESWRDYKGEQLQIKIDGKLYLISSINCVLIENKRD